MEQDLLILLSKLHSDSFTDAKELCQSIRSLVLDDDLSSEIVAYCRNKLFNSDVDLFKFADQSIQQTDRSAEETRRHVYLLIGDYVKHQKDTITDYVQLIYTKAYQYFLREQGAKAKQATLRIIAKLLKHVSNKEHLEEVVKPKSFCDYLMMHLKSYKPLPTVKGYIWQLLGLIYNRFPTAIETTVKREIQNVCLKEIEKLVETDKNTAAIARILKSFRETLHENYLEAETLSKLYNYLIVLMLPCKDTYDVPRSALKVLAQHANLFHDHILATAKGVFTNCVELMSHKNRDLKEYASEAMEAISMEIAKGIYDEPQKYEQLYNLIMKTFWDLIKEQAFVENRDDSTKKFESAGKMVIVIKTVGLFSRVIVVISGKEQLKILFHKLLEMCDRKMMKSFEVQELQKYEGQWTTKNSKSMSSIMYGHKQLYSFIGAFANIIEHVDNISFSEAENLERLFVLAVKQYAYFYEKYRPALMEAVVNLIISFSAHSALFVKWLKRTVTNSLKESLDSNRFMIATDDDYFFMVGKACDLWSRVVAQAQWTGATLVQFTSVFFDSIEHQLKNLDVSYRSVVEEEGPAQSEILNIFSKSSQRLVPANLSDFQYMASLVLLFDHMLQSIDPELYVDRVFGLYSDILRRIKAFPKSVSLLKICRTLNDFINRNNYLDRVPQIKRNELVPCISSLFIELYESLVKHQGEILYEALKVLMSAPLEVVSMSGFRILKHHLPSVLLKSLELGQEVPTLALSALRCLQLLYRSPDRKRVEDIMNVVIPQFEKYISIKDTSSASESALGLFMRQHKVTKETIKSETLRFLGRMGGLIHSIVPDLKRQEEKAQLRSEIKASDGDQISWDYDCSLTFPLPLINRKMDLKLTKLLPRIMKLMLNSPEDSVKMTSCQFMHAVVIFLIGKSASDPKRNMSEHEMSEQNSFKEKCSRIYSKILPAIFKVSCNKQHPSHQLMHTLSVQLIHFLSKTRQPNSPDIVVLLNILCEMLSQSKDVSQFATKCLAELVKWNIKQSVEGSKDYPLIKMVVRNLWALTASKNVKEGTVSLLTEILKIIHKEEPLMVRYALEFCSLLLTISRNNRPLEKSLMYLTDKLVLAIKPYVKALMIEQKTSRTGRFGSIMSLLEWLYECGIFSNFGQQRLVSYMLWQKILTNYGTLLSTDIKSFLYERARKETKTLFVKMQQVLFNEPGKLVGDCSTLVGYTELWGTVIAKGYFELDRLILFRDFEEVYIGSAAHFLHLLLKYQNARNMLDEVQELNEQTQQAVLQCFFKLTELLCNLTLNKDIASSIVDNLLSRIEPQRVTGLLVAMLIRPQQVIRTVSSDTILMRYPSYFRNSSILLEALCQGELASTLGIQYSTLFNFDGAGSLFEFIILQSNLYDSQLLVFLKGHSELDRVLQVYKQARFMQRQLMKVTDLVQDCLLNRKKQVSSERCLMLLKFVLEHTEVQAIDHYVFNQVTLNQPAFQKYEKLFLQYLVANWMGCGRRLLEQAVLSVPLMKTMFSISRLLQSKQLELLFDWLPSLPLHPTVSAELLQELVKFNFVLLSDCQILPSQAYLTYASDLLRQALRPSNSLSLLQCSMNLLSILLLNQSFKGSFMKEFKEALRAIRQTYLPLKMSELKEQRHKNEFTTFLKSFRNMLVMSQEVSLFDTVLNILRQKISGYYHTFIQETIEQFIAVAFAKAEGAVQKYALNWGFSIFFDQAVDSQPYENARVAVAEKIVKRMLVCTSQPTAIMLMDEYLPQLLTLVKTPFGPTNPDSLCLQLHCKRAALMLIEQIYKKVPPKAKAPQHVHQKQYHKELIRLTHDIVKKKWDHEQALKEQEKLYPNKNCLRILREYHCAAYNTLIILFISTQSKKEHFRSYLFEKKPGQVLWEHLIDTSKEQLGFEVETQFELMKPVEPLSKPISSRIKNRYCDSALFTIEEECVPKSIQPEFEVEALPTIKMQVESQASVVIPPAAAAPQQSVLQLDIVNQHPCMVNILMLIDYLHATFSEQGMPSWMESLYQEVAVEPLPIGIRVFLLKLVLNRSAIFTQEIWMTELLKYMSLKDNGAKGLHYFYRDVTKQVLNFQKMGYKSQGRLPSAAINKMMRMLPHQNGYLFTYNVDLFEGMLKFDRVYIEEKAVVQMLKIEQGKPDYLDWRLTGIIVAKSAISNKTPVLATYEDLAKVTNRQDSFKFFYKLCDVQLLRLVERMLEEGKPKCSIAAAGLFGELLKFLSEYPQGNSRDKLAQYLSVQLGTFVDHTNRSMRNKISGIVHQVVQIYPPFLEEMRVTTIVQSILHNSIKRDRALAIDCYSCLCQYFIKKKVPLDGFLFQLALRFRGAIPKLVSDDSEVHRSLIALLGILSDHARLSVKQVYNLFYYVFDELDQTYAKSTDELNSIGFFNIVIRIDDYLMGHKMEDQDYENFLAKTKRTLISGLASRHRAVNKLVFQHFEHSNKEFPSTSERLLYLCNSIYVPEFEELWLPSTVSLLVSLAKKSSDYDRLLFEESLDKLANFYDWDFRHHFKDNASQPYTPAHTLITQALKREGAASIIASQSESAGEHLQGMLRASQNNYLMDGSPVFTASASDNQIFSQSSDGTGHSQQSAASEGSKGNDGFKKPALMNIFKNRTQRKNPSDMSEFRTNNAISYNTIRVLGNDTVRFSKKSGAGVANMEEAMNRQTELYLRRVNRKNQGQVLVRKYKVGELPDIQICSRDIIDPLMLLSFYDTELAGELFGLLFESLCRTDSRESVRHFKSLLPSMLLKSQKHHFSFVSTLQKGLITLMKELKERVDCRMLTVAEKSNSYEYSVLFVEENLIQMAAEDKVEVEKAESGVSTDASKLELESWIDLMELYHHLYETDEVQGVLLRVMGVKERELMGEVFALKNKGLIHDAKRSLEEVLSVCSNERLKRFLEQQKIDCDTLLSNWEDIGTQLKSKPADTERSDLQTQLLVTSQISTARSSEEIAQIRALSSTLKLERLFYEQAMLSIACRTDIDRAKYLTEKQQRHFITEWDKLSSFAIRSKHELLQIIQKNYELKEFLELYSKVDLSVVHCRNLFKTWTERNPSAVHDGHLSWMQLLEARLLYARLMEERYGVSYQLTNSAATDWYVQIGVGMVKKGLLGGAQTLMKKAIVGKRGSKIFPWEFYKSTAKLKLKQIMVQLEPEIVENALYEFEQTPNIIRREMDKFEDVSQEVKMLMNLMQVKFYEAFLDKHSSNVANAQTPAYFVALYASTIDKAFSLMRKTCVSELVKRQSNENLKLKRKAYVTLTCFTERLLTMLEEPFEIKPLKNILAANKLTAEHVSSMFAQSLIKSLQFAGVGREDKEYRQKSSTDYLSSLILKLLKVVQKHSDVLGDVFVQAIEQKKIPVWLFLYFLPQAISVLNLECSRYFEEMFMGICRLYPEAIIYQFNSQFERRHLCKTETSQKIYDYLHQRHPIHFLFIEALDNLTHPELRLKDSLMRLKEKDTQNEAVNELDDMLNNTQYYGKYNKKYVEDRSRKIGRILSLYRANDRAWVNEVDDILRSDEMKSMKIPKGFLTLSDFSVFFDEYSANDWPRITVPGQFNTCGEQPILQTTVTIQSFDQSILALSSLRRPKRLTLYGNNERKYMFLVKGGEDLRLDQRIEQLFGVINRIMDRNCECQKRELFIRRFEVVPMRRWMGLLEWVDNTEVLRDFVERQYKEIRDPKGDLYMQNKSYEARVQFLSTLSTEKDRIQMHKPLLTCGEREVVANLKRCEFLMPYGMLRRAIERLSKNYDSYLHLKNRFISNFAVASVACYLLGIGDRHLDNFLVHVPTATIILIDFGYSFGSSLDLPLPELVPFRLTKIFRELMDPIGINGNFKASMTHSMFALRDKWHQLIDFCDVFINDPVLDWTYIARKKRVIRTVVGGSASMSQESSEDQSFFKKKIEYVQSKLQGKNPRMLLSQAIGDSKHKEVAGLRKLIEGNKKLKPSVSAAEQVELLIEMATDKNILGRAFTPWCPYV